MGLAGLHIIHKTPTMHHILWSTFEQIDNALSNVPHDPKIPFSFYNPSCQLPDPCAPNATPKPTPPPPAPPAYQPVQVERLQDIQEDVKTLNAAIQGLIRQTNSDSVWQYYRLINVLWPKNNGTEPGPGATIPIPINASAFTSSGPQPVNNVTLETYVQTLTCTVCHTGAAIAPSKSAGCEPKLASDFSFVFDDADTPDHYRAKNCQSNE